MKKIIVANWKMNPETLAEARKLFLSVQRMAGKLKSVQTVICSPAVFIADLVRRLSAANVSIGGQDCFFKENGPFTGEISPLQLRELGVKYVILGHSERRAMGESDELISRKVRAALRAGLRPILCVGEGERDNSGSYLQFIRLQLKGSLSGVEKRFLAKLIIAYEPVWAVGARAQRADTPRDVLEMSIYIKKILSDSLGPEKARQQPVVYGGSVEPENVSGFLTQSEVDGLLVGRASLNPKSFNQILEAANLVK